MAASHGDGVGEFADAIPECFGLFTGFEAQLIKAAATTKGSGWGSRLRAAQRSPDRRAGLCPTRATSVDRCLEAFFFYGNHFAGVSDRTGDAWYLDIVRQDGNTVTLGYPTLRDGDADCCPTGPSTIRRFTWNGSHVIAGIAAPPSAGFAPGAVPTAIIR